MLFAWDFSSLTTTGMRSAQLLFGAGTTYKIGTILRHRQRPWAHSSAGEEDELTALTNFQTLNLTLPANLT
jgi:hypothetical protein